MLFLYFFHIYQLFMCLFLRVIGKHVFSFVLQVLNSQPLSLWLVYLQVAL